MKKMRNELSETKRLSQLLLATSRRAGRTLPALASVVLVGVLVLGHNGTLGTTASGASTSAPSAHSPKNVRQDAPVLGSRCDAPATGSLSYNYPVKPFKQQHPIRGYFGDPRTPSSKDSVYAPGTPGPFNFHAGVDVVTTTGTPVYPVVSGMASAGYDNVIVRSADGRVFQYYHIWPQIRSGQYVSAYETVLGKTQPHFGHVHLTEITGGEVHNPLDPGHLEPYRDETVPVVDSVRFTDSQGKKADPLRLKGSVGIAVDAHDMPALPIVGDWPGLGVTPAVVEWDLRALDGSVVIPLQTARDFQQNEPSNEDFWQFYAAGTQQNKYGENFPERVWIIGRYVVNLTPSGLETRTLANGTYELTVRVADTCNNRSSFSTSITISN
jgi:murein DD-endopeptidase MepM/ murein hydrolase activator NlpD